MVFSRRSSLTPLCLWYRITVGMLLIQCLSGCPGVWAASADLVPGAVGSAAGAFSDADLAVILGQPELAVASSAEATKPGDQQAFNGLLDAFPDAVSDESASDLLGADDLVVDAAGAPAAREGSGGEAAANDLDELLGSADGAGGGEAGAPAEGEMPPVAGSDAVADDLGDLKL